MSSSQTGDWRLIDLCYWRTADVAVDSVSLARVSSRYYGTDEQRMDSMMALVEKTLLRAGEDL
jgi:hypothetical protein